MAQIACYVRVSTTDQNLERQLEQTSDYATSRLDATLDELTHYRDKSTGTDTKRSGYRELLADAEAGAIDAVVVSSVSRIARSIRDLDRTADRLVDAGVELHVVNEGLRITGGEDPYQRALFQLLGVFAELEANMTQQRTREGIAVRQQSDEYHHGPAPLGFQKDDGALVENEQYDAVVTTLELIAKGELSKRKGAAELDTSRRTINRALEERPELYGL